MEDEGWLSLGVAAALAREYASDQRHFLETLARLLEDALPGRVEVVRRGSFLARRKPVSEIRIDLGENCYSLTDPGRGPLAARRSLIKRGIVLRTDEVPAEEWIAEVGAGLDDYARGHQQAASAMRRFCGL
jgi:hypothetical protein